MTVLIVYDSMYGNTEKVAKAMGEACGATVVGASEVEIGQLKNLDVLIAGSATQAFQPLKFMKAFLRSIPQGALEGVKVASFDTRMDVVEVNNWFLTIMARLFGYAAQPISHTLAKKGGVVTAGPEGFIVSNSEGPLKDGELERSVTWVKQIIS